MRTTNPYYIYFTPENRTSESKKVIKVDGKKYAAGVYDAAKKFLDHHTQAFLGALN